MIDLEAPPSPSDLTSDRTDDSLGLTAAEVGRRRAGGLGNTVDLQSSRTWGQIVRDNFLTFLNITLFGMGIALITLGLFREAVLSSGYAMLNAALGVVQEAIAKRRLDRIALLNRIPATVVRDGDERSIDPGELVVGDILVLTQGDQAVLDGVVVGNGSLSMDESLLTGESDPIRKQEGDSVYAGSFCLSGAARYQATATGTESRASTIVTDARRFRRTLTPLQRQVNVIIRILLLTASMMLGMLLLSSLVWSFPLRDTVVAAAVVLGIVPAGLFLMITVTYSMAAVRLARQKVLIQQMNAVESLSNVDVFCMDKTGTLTTNALVLSGVLPVNGWSEETARRVLGATVHSASASNRTSDAIASACPAPVVPLLDEVPFSSERRWSAVSTEHDDLSGVYVLGAPEAIDSLVARSAGPVPEGWLERGLRVMLLAGSSQPARLHDESGDPELPDDLESIAWIGIADELRHNVHELLDAFRSMEIELKIISGDHPETVASLARQAGFDGDLRLVAGTDLEAMDDEAFAHAARTSTVFGRVSPELKARLVMALRQDGHYVAMTGDGVNDVMSLKRADLGIAMESGAQATRAAADLVLLEDSFSVLPRAFAEGQRVQRGLQGVMSLFLTRVMVVATAVLLCSVVRVGFPFSPGDITLLTLLTVGIPAFGVALWARPGPPPQSLIRSLVTFVAPAGFTLALAAFAVYVVFFFWHDVSLDDLRSGDPGLVLLQNPVARDALTYLLVVAGVGLVPFACPPAKWWEVQRRSDRDWRPTVLAAAMLPLYVAIVSSEPVRTFFGTDLLTIGQYLTISLVAIAWVVGLRYVYRARLLERLLDWPAGT